MAYVDQNGLILIDEIEAAEDVKKLNATKDLLIDAMEIINQIVASNNSFQGDTANAIDVAALELTNKIKEQISGIEDEIRFINSVVERYKAIDTGIKNQVNSSLN